MLLDQLDISSISDMESIKILQCQVSNHFSRLRKGLTAVNNYLGALRHFVEPLE